MTTRLREEVRETSSLFQLANGETVRDTAICGGATTAPVYRFVVHRSPIARPRIVPPGAQSIEFELEFWRRRPDLNRGWRFCRTAEAPILAAIPDSLGNSTAGYRPDPPESALDG